MIEQQIERLEKELHNLALAFERKEGQHAYNETYLVKQLKILGQLKADFFELNRNPALQDNKSLHSRCEILAEKMLTLEINIETERVLLLSPEDAAQRMRNLTLSYTNNREAIQELFSKEKLHPAIQQMEQYLSQEDYWALISSPSNCAIALGILKQKGDRWDLMMFGNNTIQDIEKGLQFRKALFERLNHNDHMDAHNKRFSDNNVKSIRDRFDWYEQKYLAATVNIIYKRSERLLLTQQELKSQFESLQQQQPTDPQEIVQRQQTLASIDQELHRLKQDMNEIAMRTNNIRQYLSESHTEMQSTLSTLSSLVQAPKTEVPVEKYQSLITKLEQAALTCQSILNGDSSKTEVKLSADERQKKLMSEDLKSLKIKAGLLLTAIEALDLDKNDSRDLYNLRQALNDMLSAKIIAKGGLVAKMCDLNDEIPNLIEQYHSLIESANHSLPTITPEETKLREQISINDDMRERLAIAQDRTQSFAQSFTDMESKLIRMRIDAFTVQEQQSQTVHRERSNSITGLMRRASMSLGKRESDSPTRSRANTSSSQAPESTRSRSSTASESSPADGTTTETSSWAVQKTKTSRWQQITRSSRSSSLSSSAAA